MKPNANQNPTTANTTSQANGDSPVGVLQRGRALLAKLPFRGPVPDGGKGAGTASPSVGIDGRPTQELIPLQVGLFEHGREVARREGHTDAVEETVESLGDFAERSADCLGAAAYQPDANVADRLLEARYTDALKRREKLRQEHDHALAALRDRENERATLGGEPEAPAKPILVGLLGVMGMGVSLMFALHDIVFANLFPATEQALAAAFVCGGIISGLIAWSMLSSAQHERRQHADLWWFGVALALGVAMLLLRLGPAQSDRDRLVAYGFTALEVVSALVLKLYTTGLRTRWETYRAALASWRTSEQRVQAATSNVTRVEGRLSDCEGRVEGHVSDVRVREDKVRSAPLVRDAARSAVLAGYHHGLAENRGHLYGFAEKLPSREEVVARLLNQRASGQNGVAS